MLGLLISLTLSNALAEQEFRLGGCTALITTDCMLASPFIEYGYDAYSVGLAPSIFPIPSLIASGKYHFGNDWWRPFVSMNLGLYGDGSAAGFVYGGSGGVDLRFWKLILRGQLGYMRDSNSDTLGLDSPISYGMTLLLRL